MFDDSRIRQPSRLTAILEDTAKMGFDMPSESKSGSLLPFVQMLQRSVLVHPDLRHQVSWYSWLSETPEV